MSFHSSIWFTTSIQISMFVIAKLVAFSCIYCGETLLSTSKLSVLVYEIQNTEKATFYFTHRKPVCEFIFAVCRASKVSLKGKFSDLR